MKTDKQVVFDNFDKPNYGNDADFHYELSGCSLDRFNNLKPLFVKFKLNNLPANGRVVFVERVAGVKEMESNHNTPPERETPKNFEDYLLIGIVVENNPSVIRVYNWHYKSTDKYSGFKLIFSVNASENITGFVSIKQFYSNFFIAFGDKIKMFTVGGASITPEDNDAVPEAKFLEVYNNYLFASGDSNQPNQVYFSKIGNGTDWTGNNGEYENFFVVDNEDNDKIMGLKTFGHKLYIFKQRSVYVLSGFSSKSFSLQKIASVGCLNNNSIVTNKSGIYFLSNNYKLYSLTNGLADLSTDRFDLNKMLNFEVDKFFCGLETDDKYLYIKNNTNTFVAYDYEKNLFIRTSNILFVKNLTTVNNNELNFYIDQSNFGIFIKYDNEYMLVKDVFSDDTEEYYNRLSCDEMKLELRTMFTNDNTEKLLKYLYLNIKRSSMDNSLQVMLYSKNELFDNYAINDISEIDFVYRIKPYIAHKEVIIILSVFHIIVTTSIPKITVNKVGIFYNNRRLKRGVI